LVELRNGKLAIKQKILSFEKMSETMQEIVQFRDMLEQRIERREGPLTSLPEEHRPLIAKLAQESDKTLAGLTKHIQQELLPVQDEDDEDNCREIQAVLPSQVVEKAIKATAWRANYGLDVSRIPNAPMGARIPAAWQLWRWEVKDEHHDWLPKASRDKALVRMSERRQAMDDALALFNALPEGDRSLVLTGNSKIATTNLKLASVPAAIPPPVPSTEKERTERKLAKVEKEKKAKEAQSRSRNLMASFFGKPKALTAGGSGSNGVAVKAEIFSAKDALPAISQFERTFKPFLVKKGVSLAPTNWFHEVRAGKAYKGKEKESDVIVIDDDDEARTPKQRPQVYQEDDDVQMVEASEWRGLDLGQMTAEERLADSLRGLHPRLRPPALPFPPRRHPTLKSQHPYVVRTVMQKLTEAEVTGSDDGTVRKLLNLLRDRSKIPAKVLSFHEDMRPGYFGTWTRNSREVGPRRPFGKDVVSLDYTVDSEAEWEEEEEEGDVLEDVEEDADPDDPVGGDEDSDADSWLVDDDEPVDPGTPIEERFGSPDFPPVPPLAKRKSKAEDEAKKGTKKRKVVEQLVPFEKGPCWETTIGECAWEPFKAMRIQFFNGAPSPIDPFKFVAAHVDKIPQAPAPTAPTKHTSQTQPVFAVPALPEHVAASSSDVSAAPAKRALPAPKTSFPDASMPALLAKIQELNTGSLPVIVDGVYKELSAAVKKNAIEAKVREIGEKKKKEGAGAKVWVVRPEIRVRWFFLFCLSFEVEADGGPQALYPPP
ncbi:hypothetical protein PHLGIDRAFT_80200, partial [Phlebiopsis gigantea 11061_1 CR5-6]